MNKTVQVILVTIISFTSVSSPAQSSSVPQRTAIPMDQLGAAAGKQYQGDGLSMNATPKGAILRCVFQRLEGEATAEGLWLRSTADDSPGERFRVVATKVGRDSSSAALDVWTTTDPFAWMHPMLVSVGSVTTAGKVARYVRDTLTEEYSVSMDGVRQDFIIEQRPTGEGELRVQLDVTGAKVEPLVHGARLTLDGSGRRLAYHRLHVSDFRGQELSARFEVTDANRMTVVVDDASAVYPVRIDPTFSDADWVSMGTSPEAVVNVNAMAVDGSGNLFVGGSFTAIGDVVATNIAKWNGSTWSALGTGVNAAVSALVVSGTDVYAGGGFTSAGGMNALRIAKWNGSTWSALGTGMNQSVNALAVNGTDLYAGGAFTNAGGVAANRIAKWNGSTWSALGLGMNDSVGALAVNGTDLYAGGVFTNAGGVAASRIAKWSGSAWSAMGTGVNAGVNALAVNGADLYAGGAFTNAGGMTASRIAKWNGSTWSALGSGMNNTVYALAVSGSDLYAGGDFLRATNSGGVAVTVNRIAKWDGSSWSALGSGMNDTVNVLAVSGTNLFAGGFFTMAGGVSANNIAKWNGSAWSAMGVTGIDDYVGSLAVIGTDLYVGGGFETAGGVNANNIAKWNGSTWSALGRGMDDSVEALAVIGTNLFAGGFFTMAGGVSANNIAKWNGTNWSALGTGMDDGVRALAVNGTDLYAAGHFDTAGGIGANRIAKWNGSTWSALGLGMNDSVVALAVSGTNLFAGGIFTMAGGVSANTIAKWNGNAWSALGTGMTNPPFVPLALVLELAVSGTDLYAGGDFTFAGGMLANNIAKWNGNSWSALGMGMNSDVYALAVSGSDVYAGGHFLRATNSGGVAVTVNRIAKWDGSSWGALGSGMNDTVTALAVSGSRLYVGGFFTTAGGKASAYAAMANIGGSTSFGQFSNPVYSPITGFSYTFLGANIGQPYRIQTSASLATNSWTDFTNFTYTGPIVIMDPAAISGTNRFFRAVTP